MKSYIYIFKGSVYPSRVNFTLQGLPKLNISVPDWGIEGELNIEIINCDVTLKFQTPKRYSVDTSTNIETLKNYIDRITRQFIDAYCFAHSYSYDVDIERVSCEKDNYDYTFLVQGEWNIKGNNKTFKNAVQVMLTGKDTILGLVLSDFRRSIKYPDSTPMYCLRCLETIRREYFDDASITDYNKRDKNGWEKMVSELNVIINDSFKKMREFAKHNRHGVFPTITYKQREEIMNFTRDVINKFIDWMLNK